MKLLLLIFFMVSLNCFGQYKEKWIAMPGYSLFQLYNYGGKDFKKSNRKISILSITSHSWPDGRQATTIYLEANQNEGKWLFKCIDYFNKDMEETGQMCYELRSRER